MMKKSYTSPKLELITFEVNGNIANDCNYKLGTMPGLSGPESVYGADCTETPEGEELYCYFTYTTMTS